MDLATELATTCVKAAATHKWLPEDGLPTVTRKQSNIKVFAKKALELPEMRDQFERLSNEEHAARGYADRLKSLADSRAGREDMSAGGYVSTGVNRLLPVPHTGTEALIRLPAIGAAGIAGSIAGRHAQNGRFATSVGNVLKATPAELQTLFRGGGGLAGLAAGSVLTGVPLAIRALAQKRHGGEAAVRARNRMTDVLGEADAKAQAREDILQQIEQPKMAADNKTRLQKLWERRDPDRIEDNNPFKAAGLLQGAVAGMKSPGLLLSKFVRKAPPMAAAAAKPAPYANSRFAQYMSEAAKLPQPPMGN